MIQYKNAVVAQTLNGDVSYIVPDGVVSSVRALTLHNPTAGIITAEVWVNDKVIAKKALAESQSYLCPELANHVLHTGAKITLKGDGVNVMLSVAEQVL